MTQFTIDTALTLVQSFEQFPVNFDDAWVWIGYSKKQNAKDKLIRNFTEDRDYTLTKVRETKSDGSFSHYYELIKVTINCFKEIAMMAGTDKGKEVRQYFLECERQLKSQQEEFTLPKTYLEALKALVASEEQKLVLEESLKTADETITGYRNVFTGEGNLTMKQTADALNLPKLGRNNLIKYLRYRKLLTKEGGSIPTRYALERGYLKVHTSDWTSSQDGTTYTNQSAVFTFKGFCWLVQQLKTDGYKIKETPQAMWDTYYPNNTVKLRVV
jgi:phage anti-repressor protein